MAKAIKKATAIIKVIKVTTRVTAIIKAITTKVITKATTIATALTQKKLLNEAQTLFVTNDNILDLKKADALIASAFLSFYSRL